MAVNNIHANDSKTTHLTLLHSNDIHGAFQPEEKDGIKTGGLALLSGYVKEARQDDNAVYAVAGDMFRGSIIDSEFEGVSTIDLMNVLNPDVAAVGNHEIDYGISHLLFLEKCARFPIINANLFVTLNNARLFQPCINIYSNDLKILFIGILTEEVLASTKGEKIIGTLIDIEEAAKEVGIICDNYRTTGTDLTILLTHIGLDMDRKLAELLHPDWGVDFIIGGHSHDFMEKAEVINGIPIVQAGTGSSIIGRFDIEYDKEEKKIAGWKWRTVPITEENADPDPTVTQLLDNYQKQTDAKYKRIVTTFARTLTHPAREQETELGNLYADLIQWESSFDIMMMGSGAIRKKEMGPVVEYQDMLENTPFDDPLWMLEVTGAQFRRMIQHIFRDDAWEGNTEFYQYSKGTRIVYRKSTHTIEELSLNGEEITDDRHLRIAMQKYHYNSFDEFMGVPLAEVSENMRPRIVATSVNNLIEEYFSTHSGLDSHVEGRITVLE